jgi:DNA polymerase
MIDEVREVMAEARRVIEAEIEAGHRYVLDGELRARLDAPPPGTSSPPPGTSASPPAAPASPPATPASPPATPASPPATDSGEGPDLTLAERSERHAALAARAEACTSCGLAATRNRVVVGVGKLGAHLMLIGEAPGHDEDRTGEPFVGRAGQLLNRILAAIGLERNEVYIANIIKCRPPENRNPTPTEITACSPLLREQIDLVRPRVICALGRIAATTLLRSHQTLGAMRGRVHELSGIPLVVTYHPSALLRYPAYKKPTWEDMQVVQRLLGGADAEIALVAGTRT